MAIVSSSSILFILSLSSLLLSSSAQNTVCKSHTFSNNRSFSNCNDLPYLNSSLHWTLNSNTSQLTLAFISTPAKKGGWVSWGINPSALKMGGTQALIAYVSDGGDLVSKTINITNDMKVLSGKISYDVSNLTAETSADGKITIFATVKLPSGTTKINQIWQVGPSMKGGDPTVHAMEEENKLSVQLLDLKSIVPGSPPISPPTGAPSPGNSGTGNSDKKNGSVILSLFFLFLCSSIWS